MHTRSILGTVIFNESRCLSPPTSDLLSSPIKKRTDSNRSLLFVQAMLYTELLGRYLLLDRRVSTSMTYGPGVVECRSEGGMTT